MRRLPHRPITQTILGLIVLLGIALPPYEEVGAISATGQATATIVRALTITSQTPLDFGSITGGSGRIIIQHSGRRAIEGTVGVSEEIPYAPAQLTLSGQAEASYRVILPDALMFSGMGNGPKTSLLRVIHLNGYSKTLGMDGNRGMLNLSGHDTYFIGGTLVIPAGAIPGHYYGEVPVTVAYE